MPVKPTAINNSPTNIQVDQLQAALFYLMTQYSFDKCPTVAGAIVDHLQMLLQHPHIDLLPTQYAVLARLVNKWRMHDSDNAVASGIAH